MTTPLTVECNLPLASPGPSGRTRRKGPQRVQDATPANVGPDVVSPARKGKIPRVARLMALAIHFDDLLRQGLARDQSDLARLGQVTPARMSQIMSLLNLSPKIQEAILFLPAVTSGRPDLILADVLPIAREWDWGRQGERWEKLVG
ncbi:MAG: hypothetical protein U0798_03295 [Gemmataceae bacterium]